VGRDNVINPYASEDFAGQQKQMGKLRIIREITPEVCIYMLNFITPFTMNDISIAERRLSNT